jgi:uncharacterized protein
MADVYADSSALVKRHIPEVGSRWFQAQVDPVAGNVITTARISMAEVYSALNRRIREATLDAADYAHIVADFDALCATQYTLVELTVLIVERAHEYCWNVIPCVLMMRSIWPPLSPQTTRLPQLVYRR